MLIMMNDLTKYRYETFDLSDAINLSSSALSQLTAAKKEAQTAKEIAAKIAAETPIAPEVTFSEAQMEAAKTAFFEKGKQEGTREAHEQQKQTQAAEKLRAEELLLKIDSQLAGHAQKADAERAKISEKLKALAFAAAKKIVTNMPDAKLQQIENFIDGALGVISEDEKVQLVLNSKTAREFIEKMDVRFESLDIVEDDSILPNDLRILWNNGYAERKLDELWKEIGQIVMGEFNPKEFEQKTQEKSMPTEIPQNDPDEIPQNDPQEAPQQTPNESPAQPPQEAPIEEPSESPTQPPTEIPRNG
jgi:flagellar biosynthesis/type III secretory pathway protein FliH